jgi:hypothetical protein
MNTMPLKVECEFAGVGQQLLHIDCHEDTAIGCGHVHQRPCSHPWQLWFAAYEGCKDCARASMEDAPFQHNYIAACFAMWGAEASYDTMWVQGYFAGKGVVPESGATTFACSISHDVACSPDYQGQPCKLFSAAYHGCRVCVQQYLDNEEVKPRAQSRSGYNALDWALWGAANEHSTSWVQGFLEARGVFRACRLPSLVSKKERKRVFGARRRWHG